MRSSTDNTPDPRTEVERNELSPELSWHVDRTCTLHVAATMLTSQT